MEKIPKLYFINLSHRGDRYAEFMNWVEGTGFPSNKVERIEAFYTPGIGILGCLASHIRAVQTFLASGEKLGMICEDDFMPLDICEFWNHYERLFEDGVEFDVVMASYNLLESEDGPVQYLKKMLHSLSASSYLITREFAPQLLAVWEDALRKWMQELPTATKPLDMYYNDVVWMPLMKASRWYCFYPRIGKQRDSFSDIQGHVTSYEC
jgi:glycosyl transferase family 25